MYAVLIPAFNAGKTLKVLLKELKSLKNAPDKIFVINDGSTDNTEEIAKEMGVFVHTFAKNKGKGAALKKGFELFKESNIFDYLICMDADLQHRSISIDSFLAKATDNKNALIIGKRDISLKKMPLSRYLSNSITSFILSKLSRQKIYDSQSGFRLIPGSVINKVEPIGSGFQLESEYILRCADARVPIEFVDIPTIYTGGESNISHIGDTLKFLKFVIKEIFKI